MRSRSFKNKIKAYVTEKDMSVMVHSYKSQLLLMVAFTYCILILKTKCLVVCFKPTGTLN